MKQYTIRNIPDYLDRIVRKKAEKTHKSINSIIIQALEAGFLTENDLVFHDMDDLSGSWIDDPATESALRDFERIDKELWK
ncbi:MAG: Arc family DNA-binding protein [Spirochaetia bacterium]